MITVYADSLFAVNFIMDYFLLFATAKIHGKTKPIRCISGALTGAVFATAMFFCDLPFAVTLLLNVAVSSAMLLITFKFNGFRDFAFCALVFYVISVLFGGGIFLAFLRGRVIISNGSIYFDESVRKLVICAFLLCTGVKLAVTVFEKTVLRKMSKVSATAYVGESKVNFTAFCDTGNLLTEPLTGLPVCILESEKFGMLDTCGKTMYIIPYKTIEGKSGAMLGIKPDLLTVENSNGEKYACRCILAETNSKIKKGVEGVLSPCMFADKKDYAEI